MLKSFRFLTGSFKHVLANRILSTLEEETMSTEVDIYQVETLLWFLFREYPFMRSSSLVDVVEGHTIRLLDLQKQAYSKARRNWDEYLKITTILDS